MLSSTYPGSYYIKLHLNQKCFLGGRGQRDGGNFPPVKPASLLLLMSIENTSVIDGAGKGFSLVCGDDDFVRHWELFWACYSNKNLF